MALTSFSANTVIKSADVDDNFTHLSDGTYDTTANSLVTAKNEAFQNYFVSGCVWSITSGLTGAMTSGVVNINGKRLTVAAVASKVFTASKDVYVDFVDNGDGTALVGYTDNVSNTASPALAANSARCAIVVTGASISSINQGDPAAVLPIASSLPYAVADSLGNLIYNRNPNPGIIGYAQYGGGALTYANTTVNDVAQLAATVIVPTGRRIRITANAVVYNTGGSSTISLYIRESTTTLQTARVTPTAGNLTNTAHATIEILPTAGTHTYKVSIQGSNQAGPGIENSNTELATFRVDLI